MAHVVRRTGMIRRFRALHLWAAAIVASVCAIAVPAGLALPLVGATAAAAALLLVPICWFPGLLVAALVAVSLLREAEVLRELAPVLGVSRITLVLSGLVLLRAVLERRTAIVPVAALRALVGYALALLVPVAAAALNGTTYDELPVDLMRQVGYVTAFGIGLVAAQEERGRIRLFRGLAWATVLACGLSYLYQLWAAGQVSLGSPGLDGFFARIRAGTAYSWLRSIVPFVDEGPNLSAVAFVVLGAFVAPRLLLAGCRFDALLGFALVLAVGAGVLSTQSRTGLALLVVAPLPALAFGSSRTVRAAAAVGVGIACLAAAASEHLLADRRTFSLRDPTFLARVDLWRQAIGLLEAAPLVGHGYRYSMRGPLVETIPAAPGQDWGFRLTSVHSDYIGQLVDGGVLGASAFAIFLTAFGGVALRLARRDPPWRQAGVALLGMLVVLLAAMAVGSIWQSPVVSTLAWLCFGIAAAESAVPLTGERR